jgi:hypothetical protein
MFRTAFAVGVSLLLLGLASAGPGFDTLNADLRAVESGCVWKYTESGVTRYYRELGDLYYGQWYSVYPPAQGNEHGITAFDLSVIPDTALVLAAEFGFFQLTDDTAGTPPYSIHAYDCAGTEPESLFYAVDTGTAVSDGYESHFGWNRVPVNGTGVQWIKNHLASDRCRLAIAEDAWGEQAQGYGTSAPESLKPYLFVSYLPTGVEEGLKPQAASHTLRLTPNPCVRSAVLHLTTGPLDHSTTLLIYNASGRLVHSQPVRSSSFVVSTSSFPSGIYVVRCKSGENSATARFVVQHQ